jgi:hypothetical protein
MPRNEAAESNESGGGLAATAVAVQPRALPREEKGGGDTQGAEGEMMVLPLQMHRGA